MYVQIGKRNMQNKDDIRKMYYYTANNVVSYLSYTDNFALPFMFSF